MFFKIYQRLPPLLEEPELLLLPELPLEDLVLLPEEELELLLGVYVELFEDGLEYVLELLLFEGV